MPCLYDDFDLDDGVSYIIDSESGSNVYAMAPRRNMVTDSGAAAGGFVVPGPPGVRIKPLGGIILGSSVAAVQTNTDALKKALSRPGRRLVANWADERWTIAYPQNITVEQDQGGRTYNRWSAEFVCPDPYDQSATISVDVRTPTWTASPTQSGWYVARFGLTSSGSAPSLLRMAMTNTAGPTIQAVRIANATAGTGETFYGYPSLVAGSYFTLNGNQGTLWYNSAILGYWPLEDASGSATDMSGNGYDLAVAAGTPTYRAEGRYEAGVTLNGASYFSRTEATLSVTSDLTVAAAVKPSQMGTAMGILGKAASNTGYGLRKTSGDLFEFWIGNGSVTKSVTSVSSARLNEWTIVSARYVPASDWLEIFVDGRLEARTTGVTENTTTTTNAFTLGAARNTGGTLEYWTGSIDDAAVINAAYDESYQMHLPFEGVPGLGSRAAWTGWLPTLYPALGLNTIEVQVQSVTSPGSTLRVTTSWRDRYE